MAGRIAKASALCDEEFMHQLSKAITRTRPRRPSEELDDIRFFIELIDEIKGLDDITHAQVYDLLVEDFELHPRPESVPLESLKKLIQKRNKNTRN